MKRGVKTMIAGGLVILIGGILTPLAMTIMMLVQTLGDGADTQFLVPGSTQVEVTKPGKYYLWNDYQTMYNGTSYSESETIPGGLTFTFTDEQSNSLAFTSYTSMSMTAGSSSKNSIGYIEVAQPGMLDIDVAGAVNPRVFSFSQSSVWSILGWIFGATGISIVSIFAGIGILIWGFVKLMNSKKPEQA